MIDREKERVIQPLRGKESTLHADAIQRLARELGLPVDVVKRTYGEVLEKLKEEEKIRALLPIITGRHGKKHCR